MGGFCAFNELRGRKLCHSFIVARDGEEGKTG